MQSRPITSGSQHSPDPNDTYLESHGMYRKHTARDASCLFRVIAEQMYDTQMLHYEVRLECVRFMTRKRRIFEKYVRGDFDNYMTEMSKPKTYGTMVELRALCFMYRRNVVLFEPLNLGTVITYNERFLDNFRVFTNEYHFDSVYTLHYIETAAVCQSISFNLLYKMLFNLPDVNYAVERMLHPQTFDWGSYEEEVDARGHVIRINCSDGRSFQLDLPEHTKCILESYQMCHFHSIARQQQKIKREDNSNNNSSSNNNNNLFMPREACELPYMCANPMISCVRQLLNDAVTPFPYKVAKSLDPYMYRNIEFDSWNDVRKEAKRYNSYANDYNFKVGAKCRVELLYDNHRQLYTCHIQKICTGKSFCLVFVEDFGKKFLVPYDTLHPLPPDEFRPWAVPIRFQRQLNQRQFCLPKLPPRPKLHKWKKSKIFDITNYFESSKTEMLQYVQINSGYGYNERALEYQPLEEVSETIAPAAREQRKQPKLAIPAGTGPVVAPFVNYMPMPGRPAPAGQALPAWPEDFPGGMFPGPMPMGSDGYMCMHYGGYPQPLPPSQHSPMPLPGPTPNFAPPPFMFGPPAVQPQPAGLLLPPMSMRTGSSKSCTSSSSNPKTGSDHEQAEPRRSLHANGEDLPGDLGTLRYFYNMGVDMHMRMSYDQMQQFNNNNNNNKQQNMNTDQQKLRNEEVAAFNGTPPPSPDATGVASTPAAVAATAAVTPAGDAAVDKTRGRGKRAGYNKTRGKRPEQLLDVGKDNQQLPYAMILPTPTPTPSPNTNGNHFNFYAPGVAQPLPPAVYYASSKGAANPYAWNLPPPAGAANMPHGMPYEMPHNHSLDGLGTNQPPPAPATATAATPAYAVPRH
ncbi:otu [Drosophila busckii]|uniref:Otu n=2 Tax=Drosophila busckii TaxID=30019 RepID=A0A0M4EN38_DROBS|nr:otu [Drosophila busckii]